MFRKKSNLYIELVIMLLLSTASYSQTINKGMWYHQQPTSLNDSGSFYGGKKTFEGFCGTSSLGTALQYFIPNIHAVFYQIFGEVKYHDDYRGGLKLSDSYCYNPQSTYTFEDFLGHHYIGRHITQTGCSYRELETAIKNIDKDISSYSSQIAWINKNQLPEYLDKGYLIILNTIQGGGHYILIGGWDGIAGDSIKCNYYIWDSWKVPLDIDSTQYIFKKDFVGNQFNTGSANNILCYKITAATLNKIFKDQMGNGTMLAFRFSPVNQPQKITNLNTKGLTVPDSTIQHENIKSFINNISQHGITDLFLIVKGTDGIFSTKTLQKIIPVAHKKSIKVHAVIATLNDNTASHLNKYTLVSGNWIDARDKTYKNYIMNNVIKALCKLNIDGIQLDCLNYPGNAEKYTGSQEAITEYCRSIRTYMDKQGKASVLLSVNMVPSEKSASSYGQNISTITKYVNFIIPNLYTHKYLQNPDWVGLQINYFVKNSNAGCKIWTGLQSFDEDGNYTTPLELGQCIDYASANGSACIAFSRYPMASWQWDLLDQYKILNNKNTRLNSISKK